MAPGRKRGAKGVKSMSELSLGDLVLAKVKGFPAWPAKVNRTPVLINLLAQRTLLFADFFFCNHNKVYKRVFS